MCYGPTINQAVSAQDKLRSRSRRLFLWAPIFLSYDLCGLNKEFVATAIASLLCSFPEFVGRNEQVSFVTILPVRSFGVANRLAASTWLSIILRCSTLNLRFVLPWLPSSRHVVGGHTEPRKVENHPRIATYAVVVLGLLNSQHEVEIDRSTKDNEHTHQKKHKLP